MKRAIAGLTAAILIAVIVPASAEPSDRVDVHEDEPLAQLTADPIEQPTGLRGRVIAPVADEHALWLCDISSQ